jgi:hypothetical protein
MHLIERSSLQRRIALLCDDTDAFAKIGEVAFGFDASALNR